MVCRAPLSENPGRDKKEIVIKIIKRNAKSGPPPRVAKRVPQTVTATVNDWIAERRRNRLDEDSSSRNTIAGWAAEPNV